MTAQPDHGSAQMQAETLAQACPDVTLAPLADLAPASGDAAQASEDSVEDMASLFIRVNLAPLADMEALARSGEDGGLDRAFSDALDDSAGPKGGSKKSRAPGAGRAGLKGKGFVAVSESEGLAQTLGLDPAAQGLHSWMELKKPLERSLSFVSGRPQNRFAVVRPDLTLTWGQLDQSLRLLLSLLPRLDVEPRLLARHFVWYRYEPGATMTGYYAPVVDASLSPKAGYTYPLYAPPPDMVRLNLGQFSGKLKDQWLVARSDQGRVRPYYTRKSIDGDQVLTGQGLEIAWLKSPLDAFYLHVQGGGKLRLPDGSTRAVGYAGDNGRPFTGLAAILLREGRLSRERANMDAVREYFADHPKDLRPAMFQNERYIFFRFTDQEQGGSMGKPLTPMLSLATDPSLLPPGCVFAMKADLPGTKAGPGQAVSGIGLAQDRGAAIKGRRLDYYIGEGQEAGDVAQNIKTPTAIHLLVSREALLQCPMQ